MKIDGGIASAAAPKPSPQLLTSCRTSSHCARLVSWNSSTSTWRWRASSRRRLSRELVHVLEQLDRALEDAGEIEQRVRVERVLILLQRDREDPPDAARHDGVQIAPERADRLAHRAARSANAAAR